MLVFFYIYLKYACASINRLPRLSVLLSVLLDSLTRLLSTPPFFSRILLQEINFSLSEFIKKKKGINDNLGIIPANN